MNDDTTATTATPPTEADRAAAWEKRRELEAERDALAPYHPRRDDLTRQVADLVSITHAPRPAPAAPPGPSLADQIAAADEIDRLRARLLAYPEGDRRAPALIDRMTELSPVAFYADRSSRAEDNAGAFTDRDADRIAASYDMTEEARGRFEALASAIGATPLDRTNLLTTVRSLDGRTPPDPNSLDLASHWGADADANVAAVKRVRARVPAEEWAANVAPYLGVPGIVDLLAKVGRRKGSGDGIADFGNALAARLGGER